jgi:chorismate mutase
MLPIKPIIETKKANTPLFIAGPCSAESRVQLFESLRLLQQTKAVDLFRCGVWKPRSSPNSFEGMGEIVLPWLNEIESVFHIPVCIEIASAKQLEIALKAGLVHFWIGARVSVNPFIIQEIATASKGLNIAMMIKNPVSPDLRLWYGNFERFAKSGIQKLAAVYRGFSTGMIHPYRNDPMWHLLIEFKQKYREIPLYCDPSHMAGKRKYVFDIAQKALFLGVNGLMTEVHPHPEKALSDKAQQVSVRQYKKMIRQLIMPSSSEITNHTLDKYRTCLDALDHNLVHLLAQRFDIVGKIATYKHENNLPILQINRWEEVRNHILSEATQSQMDMPFINAFLDLLQEASIRHQEKN